MRGLRCAPVAEAAGMPGLVIGGCGAVSFAARGGGLPCLQWREKRDGRQPRGSSEVDLYQPAKASIGVP